MKKVKWQTEFRDLPKIPDTKKWQEGERETTEQKISKKLITGKPVTLAEKEIMQDLVLFYAILYKSLQNLEFETFTTKDFKNFENYIFYAFNYFPALANKLTIYQLYRVVINQNLIGTKESLTKKGLLSYPPLHIVKKINKFNRANTPRTNVFYGAETIDTAINEIKPRIGDKVTVGVWQPITKREFNSYPISHSEKGFRINENSTHAIVAFDEFRKANDKVLIDHMEPYLHVLGYEYSKIIKHHYEYLISAMFSEKILKNPQNKGTSFDFECIVYPSVGNKFITSNVAVRTDIIRNEFSLSKVIEFEVTQCHFDNEQKSSPESINLVEYKDYRETNTFEDNRIIWA